MERITQIIRILNAALAYCHRYLAKVHRQASEQDNDPIHH